MTVWDFIEHSTIQILTIEDLLDGRDIQMPGWRSIQESTEGEAGESEGCGAV